MNELFNALLKLVECDTFWSAVSALATVAGASAIFLAARQLRFEAWLKAQDIWCSRDFTQDRAIVFARLANLKVSWSATEREVGLNVCRRVDEFARLAPYVGKRRMLAAWGDPLAKAWLVLQDLVREERESTGWPTKWDAFENLGITALSTRPDLQAKQ